MLAYLLKNRMYLGEINHGRTSYPGEHPALIDWTVFERAQEILARNAAARGHSQSRSHASVARLSGLNVDQLRLHWRNHVGGVAPAHLPGWLLMRVLAYRIQAVAFGDLDRTILRRLREPREEAFESPAPRYFAFTTDGVSRL